MRKHVFAGVLTAVLSLVLVAQAQAAFITETEPNNSFAAANQLLQDQATPVDNFYGLSGSVKSSDLDYVKFHLDASEYTSGAALQIGLANNTNASTLSVYLYNASDLVNSIGTATRGRNTNSSRATTNLTLASVVTGDYYLKISRDSTTTGGYTVDVKGLNGAQVVPEPATLALLGLGSVAALLRRRR